MAKKNKKTIKGGRAGKLLILPSKCTSTCLWQHVADLGGLLVGGTQPVEQVHGVSAKHITHKKGA